MPDAPIINNPYLDYVANGQIPVTYGAEVAYIPLEKSQEKVHVVWNWHR